MLASAVSNWPLVVSSAVVAVVLLLLLSRYLHRDPNIRRARYGVYVERDRFHEEEPWPEPAEDERTQPR